MTLRAVVMGDIGWPDLYHVGDEAMTEAAITQLRLRGVDEVTLIAADADVASALHGTSAVSRFHFKLRWPRAWHDSHLDKVLAPLDGYARGEGPADSVYDAVHDSDFVLIAGGGNLTSTFVHQLYERLALVRVARHFGRPVFVTSQSLGATYRPADVPVIREIINSSRRFGVRERTSLETALSLTEHPETVAYTGDDALLLAREDAPAVVRSLLPDRYFVASFERPGWIDDDNDIERYFDEVASALDAVAERTGCTPVLVPHAGSFDPRISKDDVVSHNSIAARSSHAVELPLLRSGAVLDVMTASAFSLSTRYHPIVFSGQIGLVPFGLAHTAYTWNRMRGAARQYGAADLILPAALLSDPGLLADFISTTIEAGAHQQAVTSASAERKTNQVSWWDGIVGDAKAPPQSGVEPTRFVALADPEGPGAPAPSRSLSHFIGDEASARGRVEEVLLWQEELIESTHRAAAESLREERQRLTAANEIVVERESEIRSVRAELDSRREELRSVQEVCTQLQNQLDVAERERNDWRTAARQFRSEVQRYRERRITKIADRLSALKRQRD
ncbi:polysaccharide pyruvyl transferase family protein [Curtobacterium sp. PhB136]|uniref:polysaccharide pyruvyl transferase family protein n=1 Tax=Curtobacterium sp. PhB136 TaxID=2485181 RepID=UPI001045F36F|nr:polysaccharide pyruvyl transferase family protein [Curtobacterium sp. PhB136]TCK62993.1 polysaccharide pyruvyl transferase WcaK-like protein [Curtobacterium sp. PhB136]